MQMNTQDKKYTDHLIEKQSAWWKKLLDVQRPYRWNLQRLNLGFVLDIGCGLGRNLIHLEGNGVGIDHNSSSVEMAKSLGLTAYTIEEFQKSEFCVPERFDSLLISHVAEHLTEKEVIILINMYLPYLKVQGKVILITPQECGYRSDPTHVQFMNFDNLQKIVSRTGLQFQKNFSFPFPRIFGLIFRYNEFICIARKNKL